MAANEQIETNHVQLVLPGLLDGFMILHRTRHQNPAEVSSLDISRTAIHTVIDADLQLFINLHEVDASETGIQMHQFSALPDLHILKLSANDITEVNTLSNRFVFLTKLDLSFNRISHTSLQELSALPSLACLDLTANGIKQFPVSASNDVQLPFSNLKTLILQDNAINSENDFLCLAKLPKLQTLVLNKNEICSLSCFIPSLGSGEKTPSTAALKSALPSFHGFYQLTELHLAYNNISTKEDILSLTFISSLQCVFLQGNPIMKPSNRFDVQDYASTARGFNVVDVLKKNYNILVADPCYLTKPNIPRAATWRTICKRKVQPGFHPNHQFIKVKEEIFKSPKKLTEKDLIMFVKNNATDTQHNPKSNFNSSLPDIQASMHSLSSLSLVEEKEFQRRRMDAELVEAEKMFEEHEHGYAKKTFLTDIPTLSIGLHEEDQVMQQSNESAEIPSRKDELDFAFNLPTTLAASIRTLKEAIHNPTWSWKEHSYAKSTAASEAKRKPKIELSEHFFKYRDFDRMEANLPPATPAQQVDSMANFKSIFEKVDTHLNIVEARLSDLFESKYGKAFAPEGAILAKEIEETYAQLERELLDISK